MQTIPFGSTISLNNLLQTAYGSAGVQSIRIATAIDNPNNYGIQIMNIDGSKQGTPYTKDILLDSNNVPNLYGINYTVFGVNNY